MLKPISKHLRTQSRLMPPRSAMSTSLLPRLHLGCLIQQRQLLSSALLSRRKGSSKLIVPKAAPSQTSSNGTPTPKTNPPESLISIWRGADAVCFDVDCTITTEDSLDLLAEFMGVGAEVQATTNKAMDGSMNLEDALTHRLNHINCKPSDIKRFLAAHPPEKRLVKGVEKLIKTLQGRGVAVYMISGGFRELVLPIAAYLGVPKENIFCNRMTWQWDDETGEPTRLVGFDMSEPTAHNQGKPQAIIKIRQKNPYNTIVMIGDGITDLEAVQLTGGADLFIGFGGVVERPAVAAAAEWFIHDYGVLMAELKRYKIAMIGSGAWACAAIHMVAQNAMNDDPADFFDDEVKMWVYEEDYQGRKLTEVINETHENPKYLPGVYLGANVKAEPDLEKTVQDADILLFCTPHQFTHRICKQLMDKVKKDAIACSLIKGMRVRPEGPQLISQMVNKYLGLDCSVLMGANIAGDIGKEQLSEAVIGYSNRSNAKVLQRLFQRKYFNTIPLNDPVGAEMCGTLKNIVALAAGIVDGLDYGPNTKAAILRQGLDEMRMVSKALYANVRDETFFTSAGMGDLIATCIGGRNRRVAEAWTRAWKAGNPKSFDELEAELLHGQKLQGVLTSNEMQEILRLHNWEADYPLFTTTNRIINYQLDPTCIVDYKDAALIKLDGRQQDVHVKDGSAVKIGPLPSAAELLPA